MSGRDDKEKAPADAGVPDWLRRAVAYQATASDEAPRAASKRGRPKGARTRLKGDGTERDMVDNRGRAKILETYCRKMDNGTLCSDKDLLAAIRGDFKKFNISRTTLLSDLKEQFVAAPWVAGTELACDLRSRRVSFDDLKEFERRRAEWPETLRRRAAAQAAWDEARAQLLIELGNCKSVNDPQGLADAWMPLEGRPKTEN